MTSAQLKKDGVLLETMPLSGLEIRQLRAFVALVERKRVTAAAEALGLAQSTVSEALSALERALDTPLILRRRGGHGLELTEAGRALLPHARKILSAVDDAHTAIAAAASHAQANVEIVANESVSTYLLPGILPQLRQHWPQTRFTVSVATCAGVREGVTGGAFDVGLLLEELVVDGSPAHTSASLAPFSDRRVVVPAVPLVLFAGASHALIGGRSAAAVRRDALVGYPLFVSDGAGDFHDLVWRFFKGDGLDGPAIEATGSIEGVKKAVINDVRAIGLLPEYAVADELRAAAIARVNLRPAPPMLRLACAAVAVPSPPPVDRGVAPRNRSMSGSQCPGPGSTGGSVSQRHLLQRHCLRGRAAQHQYRRGSSDPRRSLARCSTGTLARFSGRRSIRYESSCHRSRDLVSSLGLVGFRGQPGGRVWTGWVVSAPASGPSTAALWQATTGSPKSRYVLSERPMRRSRSR